MIDLVPLSELARIKGVSPQAIGKRVDRLVAAGILSTKPGPRGGRLVSVAAFDRAANDAKDAVRSANGLDEENPRLAYAQARKVGYQAELARLDLEERKQELVPVAEVKEAMARAAEAMVKTIERLPAEAEACAAAVAASGVAGARKFLRETARGWRERLARELRSLKTRNSAD